MARIALVYFGDHTPGASIDPATVSEYIEQDLQQSGARLVGLFDFPNRVDLQCRGTCVVKHTGAWVRDPRGFMKCDICGSRSHRLRRWLIGHLFDLLGANLYSKAPAAFRTPDGYGPSAR